VSVKCYTAVPANQQLSFGSTQPEFNARCTSIVGSVSRPNALAGYPTLLTSSGATMTIATVDGSVASGDCSELLLQRCMQHKFNCSVQNLAGWSPAAESQVVTTLPDQPAKATKPQVKQIDEDGAMLADRFTLVLEAPGDTAVYGGACSQYSFQVIVKLGANPGGTVVVNTSGLLAEDFVVGNLAAATTYSVTVQARNQAGWGTVSDVLEVKTLTPTKKITFRLEVDADADQWENAKAAFVAEMQTRYNSSNVEVQAMPSRRSVTHEQEHN